MIKSKIEVTPRQSKPGTIYRGRVRLWHKGEKQPYFQYSENFKYQSDTMCWRESVQAALDNGECIKALLYK
mgnify:CR=1 FL=1